MPSFCSDIEDIVEEKRTVFYEEKTSNVLDHNKEDIKIEVVDKGQDNYNKGSNILRDICFLIQMLPAGNMVCRISLATGFTVMFMWNMEMLTPKWAFNFR